MERTPAGSAPAWLAAVFLVTGAGLVAHLLFPVPLPISLLAAMAAAAALVAAFGRAGHGEAVVGLVRVGLAAGAVATFAYDISRAALASLTPGPGTPFAAWPYFGGALLGAGADPAWRWAAGAAFHVTNGLLFAVAFVVFFRDRGPLAGVAWALVLEAFMLGLYPGWLGIEGSALVEFVQLSVVGHLVYGVVLGTMSRRLLRTAR